LEGVLGHLRRPKILAANRNDKQHQADVQKHSAMMTPKSKAASLMKGNLAKRGRG
jgi:hypothetical protein